MIVLCRVSHIQRVNNRCCFPMHKNQTWVSFLGSSPALVEYSIKCIKSREEPGNETISKQVMFISVLALTYLCRFERPSEGVTTSNRLVQPWPVPGCSWAQIGWHTREQQWEHRWLQTRHGHGLDGVRSCNLGQSGPCTYPYWPTSPGCQHCQQIWSVVSWFLHSMFCRFKQEAFWSKCTCRCAQFRTMTCKLN